MQSRSAGFTPPLASWLPETSDWTLGPCFSGSLQRGRVGGTNVLPAKAPGLSGGAGDSRCDFSDDLPSPGCRPAPALQGGNAMLSIPSCVTQQPVSSYSEWIEEWRASCVVTVFNIPPASHYIIQLLSKRIFSRLGFVIKIVINFFLFTKPEDLQMEASGARAASFWKWPF